MSVVKIIQVKNRLREQLRKPGGQTVAQSLEAACQALDDLKAPTLARIDEMVVELEALARAQAPGSLVQVYHLASGVLDLAGTFEEEALCEAATSLCDLLALFGKGAPDWASVTVHVRALKLIRQADGQGVEAVLDGLRRVVAKAGG